MGDLVKIGKNGEVLADDSSEWAALIDEKTKLMWAVNLTTKNDFPNSKKKISKGKISNWVNNVNRQGWCGYNNWKIPSFDNIRTFLEPVPINDYEYVVKKEYLSIFSHINKISFSLKINDCYVFYVHCYKKLSAYNFSKRVFDDFQMNA
jgi:hypothetical protein